MLKACSLLWDVSFPRGTVVMKGVLKVSVEIIGVQGEKEV